MRTKHYRREEKITITTMYNTIGFIYIAVVLHDGKKCLENIEIPTKFSIFADDRVHKKKF